MTMNCIRIATILLLTVNCTGAQDVKLFDRCPVGTKTMQTPKITYCVCIGSDCVGSECRAAKHSGTTLHGYPANCTECQCAPVSKSMINGVESSKMVISKSKPQGLRVIYIKSYKVASTTIASIFQRLSEEQGLKAATRYNAGMPMSKWGKGTMQIVYGHNFYDADTNGGYPCQVKRKDDGSWTQCGGYQAWMDHYVQDAHHVIMVAEPLSRIASMYYYEAGFTKQKDRAPEDQGYSRISNEARFLDPQGEDVAHIAKFLRVEEFYSKWERVQWWWIRDMTNNRTVSEGINLLNKIFTVGLSHRLDETLLIWKSRMHLETRDIVYTSMKSSLPHPKISNWTEENRQVAEQLISANGDLEYYREAEQLFERQIVEYGEKRLTSDVTQFRSLILSLQNLCRDVAVPNEMLHVPDQVYCMLRHYDKAYEKKTIAATDEGCFKNLEGTTSRYYQKQFSSQMTITVCRKRCVRDDNDGPFQYFALAYGTHCYCGKSLPPANSKQDVSYCDSPCGGNDQVHCGGITHYSIHKILARDDTWSDIIISGHDLNPVAGP